MNLMNLICEDIIIIIIIIQCVTLKIEIRHNEEKKSSLDLEKYRYNV